MQCRIYILFKFSNLEFKLELKSNCVHMICSRFFFDAISVVLKSGVKTRHSRVSVPVPLVILDISFQTSDYCYLVVAKH